MSIRASQGHRFGPFHVRLSEPITGSGKPYFTIGIHLPVVGYVRLFRRIG
jgi:hypothetical protein